MKKLSLCLLFALGTIRCAPKVFIIDRHTVMEDEAAGEWPDIEKSLLTKAQKKGTTFLKKDSSSFGERRALNIPNGEFNSFE